MNCFVDTLHADGPSVPAPAAKVTILVAYAVLGTFKALGHINRSTICQEVSTSLRHQLYCVLVKLVGQDFAHIFEKSK